MTDVLVTQINRYTLDPDWHTRTAALDEWIHAQPYVEVVNERNGRKSILIPAQTWRDLDVRGSGLIGPTSAQELRAAGRNPDDWRVTRIDDSQFRPYNPDPREAVCVKVKVNQGFQEFDAGVVTRLADHVFYAAPPNDRHNHYGLLLTTQEREDLGLTFFYRGNRAGQVGFGRGDYWQYNVFSGHVTVVEDAPTPVTVTAELRDTVNVKEASKKQLRRMLAAAEEAHKTDMEKVSKRLEHEAEERGWCDDYDHIIRDLNNSLAMNLTPRRRYENREIPMEVTLHVTRRVRLATDATPEEIQAAVDQWGRNEYGARMQRIEVR